MTTDTKLQELIINKLTTSQYDSIEKKDPNQIYIVTDAPSFDNTITNCLTRIPQDIKLELVDGTLTLKAGSKVYVPNGFDIVDGTSVTYYGWYSDDLAGDVVYTTSATPNIGDILYSYNGVDMVEEYQVDSVDGDSLNFIYSRDSESDITLTTGDKIPKFDVITTESDLSVVGAGTLTETCFILYKDGGVDYAKDSEAVSGTTAPTGNGFFYNTNTNKIDFYISGVAQNRQYSFPLCIVTRSSGLITSINQIFNSFGYIGSTFFYYPKIQGKTANGLNPDGTYKGTDITTNKVVTRTFSSGDNGERYLGIYGSNLNITYNNYESNVYDIKTNRYINTNNGKEWADVCVLAICKMTKGVISNFRPYSTFQAVDRNDTSWLSELSMPSSKYIDLTLGANGSSYTAPANGWLILTKGAKAVGQYIELTLKPSNLRGKSVSVGTADNLTAYVPAKKGAIVEYWGSAAGTTSVFRFIYAEGEQ